MPDETVVQPAEPGTEVNEQTDSAGVQNDDASNTSQKFTWIGKFQEYGLFFLLFTIAVTLIVYWILRKSHRKNPEISTGEIETGELPAASKHVLRKLKQQLQNACNHNDARSAATILLEMAAMVKPEAPPKTLPALAAMLEHGSEEIYNLDRHMYASVDADWNGDNFYESFREGLVFKALKKEDDELLAPLYPG